MAKSTKPVTTTEVAVPVVPPTSTAIAVPTIESLAKVEDEGSAPSEGRGGSFAYVGFFGEKTKTATRQPLEAAGIRVGTFYLHHVEPIKVEPFGMHLISFSRLFTKQDSSMNITDAVLKGDQKTFNDGYREHLFGVVAVRLPTPGGKTARGFVPAVISLRGGQALALGKAIEILPYAAKASDWSARSEAHAASAGASIPGGRFVTTIYSSPEDTGDGNTFNKGHGVIWPTPREDVAAFNAWLASPGVLPAIGRLQALNKSRVDEARKVLRDA